MTQRPVSFVLASGGPDKPSNHPPLTVEPPEPTERHDLPLGHMIIVSDDPDFRKGYDEGRSMYEQWHCDDLAMSDGLLLFLLRNGWGESRHSDIWQTGYIVGWLSSLFAHAYKVGEVL